MKSVKKRHRYYRGVVVATGFLAVAAINPLHTAVAAERSATQRVDDAAITAQVKTRLLADEVTRSININVDTEAGVVTLRGTAPTAEAKAKAEQVAKSVEGVQVVANSLIVGDSSMNPQTVTAKAKEVAEEGEHAAGDAWITTKVKAQLLADSDIKGLDINVSTKDGVVTLAGMVPSKMVRDKAISIAKGVKGVKSVNSDALKAK